MPCCHYDAGTTGRLFSRFSWLYCRRYRRRGPDPTQQQLIAGVGQVGWRDRTILEIGSGVGYLHQWLLQQGARLATGVDLSRTMLQRARALAVENGLQDRTRYLHGDFVALSDRVGSADITILDRVICCYPDATALLEHSLPRTHAACALTYPRIHLFNRIGVALGSALMWLLRIDFRNYLHSPQHIEQLMARHGFSKAFEDHTALWLTQVFVRAPAA